MEKERFIELLSELIEEGKRISNSAPSIKRIEIGYLDVNLEVEYKVWRLGSLNLIRNYFGESHNFFRTLSKTKCNWSVPVAGNVHYYSFTKDSIANQYAVLIYIKEQFSKGLLTDAQHFYEANLFSNLLDEAFHLVENDYLEAAAIYGRLITENYINDLIRFKKIELEDKDNFSQKLIKLRNADVFDLPTERMIQAQYDIGTYATHRKEEFKKYDKDKIKDFLTVIRTKILTIK